MKPYFGLLSLIVLSSGTVVSPPCFADSIIGAEVVTPPEAFVPAAPALGGCKSWNLANDSGAWNMVAEPTISDGGIIDPAGRVPPYWLFGYQGTVVGTLDCGGFLGIGDTKLLIVSDKNGQQSLIRENLMIVVPASSNPSPAETDSISKQGSTITSVDQINENHPETSGSVN